LIFFHRKNKADFTVSVNPVSKSETKELGILRINSNDRITAFKEKPKKFSELKGLNFKGNAVAPASTLSHPAYLASMGVYLFNVKTLVKALEGNYMDFGREVIPNSIEKYKAFGYVFNGYWRDIGTIRTFYDSNMDFAAQNPRFSFFHGWNIFTRPRFLPSALLSRCRVERSLITEGCVVEDAEIRNSVIGLRSVIGKRCRIAKTVMMGADHYESPNSKEPIKVGIGDGTTIERAIVDKNARVGRNVVIKNLKNLKNFDGENYYIRDGIVIIPKNAVIKDGTKI